MKKIFAPLAVIACLTLSGCNAASTPEPTVEPTPTHTKPACQTDFQEIRAKTAYQVLASGARYAFYQFGRSAKEATTSALEDRFQTQLVNAFVQQTQSWPLHVSVDIPGITFTSASYNIDCSQITLHTVESWRVVGDETANKGQVFFSEISKPHDISMVKVPGIVTERWEVESISGFQP